MKSETTKQQADAQRDDADVESPTPRKPPSYSMVDPRMMRIYLDFYRETYSSQHACLDRRTQELIAIAASLVAKCQGCLEGHIKKALKEGVTKDEIAESIAIAMGVNAAAIVDLTDIAAARLNLEHFK
ncbi:MAG: carboxymuconolactone decarboxylase family protein [Pyrinomonadaceae bacterium]